MSIADLASVATAAGAIVLLSGLVHAALRPRDAARVVARSVVLALEFLLAAGLLRLGGTMTFTGLAAVAGVVATRRIIALGLGRIRSAAS